MLKLFRAASLVVLAGLALPALAGETGSISGVVKDSQGGVLPGVTVKVTGDVMPGGREMATTDKGEFFFTRLLPGNYKVEASLTGLGSAAKSLRVSVDVDAQVNIVLSPTVQETIEVTAQAPAVDLKNTEVNFNYTADTIEDLPLDRSYKGLFQLIPGVAENNQFAPAAGGSRQDNTYLIDGVNITNPGFGYLSTEVNELDIAEFNIKRGAISAEFGRSAGFVANAVSKSGTNELHGTARFEYQAESLASDPEVKGFGNTPFEYLNPAFALGGPLVKDKLFWYGSARYFKTTTGDRVNRLGGELPDRIVEGHELYGKITASPSQKHLFTASFRDRPNTIEGSVGIGSAASVATEDDNGSRVATASWSFFATNRTSFDLKYLYLSENNESVPVTDLGYLPTPFNHLNPAASGQYTDPNQGNLLTGGSEYSARVNYTRQEVKFTASQFFDLGSTSHQLKAGGGYEFGEEDFFREANGWGQISRITVSGAPVYRARYYFTQAPQLGQGRTVSVFLQDTMTVNPRLTLNLGVLINRDEFAQDLEGSGGCPSVNTVDKQPGGAAVFESEGDRCTFIRFDFFDQVQPRLGFNFNLREGAGDKVYGNWGRYYNSDQKSSGRSLAPRRIYQREARFNATTGALISDAPRASTTGKLIDKELKPTYNDEFLFGYATPVGKNWNVDVFFIYRNTENFMEDVPSVLNASTNPNFSFPYAVGNLPCDTWVACTGADAERKYQAFTFEVSRRLADKWSLNASYTWSKFEGNFDLDYSSTSSVFNTSSFIQDGPGTYVQEAGRYGPLRQDRPHLFKLFANFVPVSNLTLGGYLRVQSGTPWNARGQDTQGGAALYYLEPAGANRNPTWTNFDFLAAYRWGINDRTSLTFEARALNLFNTQTQLSTDSVKYTDTVVLSTPPGIAPGTILNPAFGTGNEFAPPRRLLLTARLDF